MASSLNHKTIRPGSLNSYSYYYSGRRPVVQKRPKPAARPLPIRLKFVVVAALMLLVGYFSYANSAGGQEPPTGQVKAAAATTTAAPVVAQTAADNHCQSNTHAKLIKVSIDERHLWACEGTRQVYDTPVITGLRGHPETETPPGSYHIYAKQKDTTLTGTDSRGSWSDPVYYWMPFLDNQYGTYGFHDATWRNDNEFGSVGPDSEQASHGCVELPLGSSKWLYDWASVKTPVIVES